MQPRLIVATDFSGLGSPEEALKRLNVDHRIAFACERDKYARASYEANHKAEIFYDDVTTRDNKAAPYADLYAFGFPCQAFSLAGHRKGFEDTRGTLFFNCLEYIDIHRPRVFIAENVKGLLSHDKVKCSKSPYGKTFGVIRDALALTVNGQHNLYKYDDCVNYHVYFQVLNTKDYTVPQNRERIFIVGFRDEADALKFNMPSKKPLIKRLKDVLEDDVASKYYLSEKMINYLTNRKDNFNNGKINFKCEYDVASCINASSKSLDISDNIILEKQNRTRLISPTSPTILANQAKQSTDSIFIVEQEPTLIIKDNTKKGYAEANLFDSINLSNPNSKTRRGRIGNQIANTLDTACNQSVVVQLNASTESGGVQPYQQNRLYDADGLSPALSVEASHTTNVAISEGKISVIGNLYPSDHEAGNIYDQEGIAPTIKCNGPRPNAKNVSPKIVYNYKIRRLTPLECFRLQGYSDLFFCRCASINSDTQLYKQAGNSICVDTIMHLLIQVLKAINVKFNIPNE